MSYNEAVIGEKNLLGGGIYFSNGSNNQLSITGGEIKNNCSKDSGGGIQITTGLTVSIANCTIQGNSCGAKEAVPLQTAAVFKQIRVLF